MALWDPNRGPNITVSLPGRKPYTGPISNLVFPRSWQLVSDDKLTEILPPPGNFGTIGVHTHTHTGLLVLGGGFSEAKWQVLHRLGACNSIENRKWLVWLQVQISDMNQMEGSYFYLPPLLKLCVYLIDEQRNGPLVVEGSCWGVGTLVCQYTHRMCSREIVPRHCGSGCSLPAPWKGHCEKGKAQLTQGKVHHLSFSAMRTHLTKKADLS